MEIKDIVVSNDFYNFTNDELVNIFKENNIEINKDVDIKQHCYEIRNMLFENSNIRNLLENKIFAGKKSIKLYKINIPNKTEKERLRKKIESDETFDNLIDINTDNLQSPVIYTCIKCEAYKYILRVFVPTGYKTVSNGRSNNKLPNINNVLAIIDLNKSYIEIRTNFRDAKRIKNLICSHYNIDNVTELDVLAKFNGSIEDFKNNLYNGKFIETASIPEGDVNLTKEESEMLAGVLKILDDYFINKDLELLNEELSKVDLETNNLPFTQLFLAGLSKIGIGIKEDIENDLSDQSLYFVLKPYITNSTGFISFSLPGDPENRIVMQIGIDTKSISFRSYVTEDVINYLREKIL